MRIFIWLYLITFCLLRIFGQEPLYQENDFLRITTRVTNEPVKYDDCQRLSVKGLSFYLPLFPEINYGDTIIVQGKVAQGRLHKAELIEIQKSKGFIYQLRNKIIKTYQKSLPEPHASLVAGVTLGSKSSIPKDFWQSLKRTGTAHVVVASGMNVTLVAGFLMNFLVIFLPRGRAVPLALLGIWVYSLISGFEAPVIRAAIMGSIAFSAQALGRFYDAWRALFFAALLMIIIEPIWLKDLGFILSFVATASLMLFEAKISKILPNLPSFFKEGLSTSLAAQIGVAPIIFVSFGQFYWLSPLVNALVLWVIGPLTVISGLAGLVGLIIPQLGTLILWLIFPLTAWFVLTINFFG